MTSIKLDQARCVGHALCSATAPEIYDLDDDGYCLPPPDHVDGAEARQSAIAGANACPERALAVTD
ncbi:ferredoxin [Williamsia sp. DF01-3]|uniref:ferredoxin n=1 Tax=Williamsia sp. DF01-3 TaxID=2934157 RepID=UPI001FF1788B|nr:ferredoxin [Williamsia sp. DF01-3]MCK0516775.1 ferredoxin [Williamsia sp. DF01-3]